MSKSLYKKISVASAIMMLSIVLSRILGILREMAIAYLGGAGWAVDAYQLSFIIPEILNHILAGGFLSITFIPIFSKYLVSREEDKGWKVFSNILVCFGALMILLIIILFYFAPEIISLTGLREPKTISAAVRMTRIIIPAQFFFFVGGLFMAVQFAKESFFIPSLAPLLYNLGIIMGGLFLSPWLGMEGFSWGALIGAFVGNFALQGLGAKKAGMRFYFIFDLKHPDLKKYIILTLPLMFGLTMTFSTEVIPRFFGSYLAEGSVAGLGYGLRVMFLLVAFFGQAIGVASYPFMARLAAQNKMTEMNRLLSVALRRASLVIPFSALLMVLRKETVFMLFQRGNFNAASTQLTADILMFLLIGAFAFTAQTIVNRGYYALNNTLFPALFVSAAVLATIPLYWLGMKIMGVNGVALALSVSVILQSSLLYVLWSRSYSNAESKKVYFLYGKIMILSISLGLFALFVKDNFLNKIDNTTLLGNSITFVVTSLIFIIGLLITGYIFKIKEIYDIFIQIYRRLNVKTG